MKKIIALILVVLCIIPVFSGCSMADAFKEGFQEGLEDGFKVEVGEENVDTDENTTTGESDKEDEIDISGSTGNTTEEKEEFVFGKVNGKTYSNEFTGISCTLPDSWVYHTDEEIKALNNITTNMLDDDIAEMVKKATIIYDMQASDPSTGNNTNINLEKLPSYASSSVNIETILKNQFTALKQSLESVGATVEKMEYEKITVDRKEYDGISVVSNYNGVKMEQNIICFQKDEYLVYLTVTATQEGKLNTLLSYFEIDN